MAKRKIKEVKKQSKSGRVVFKLLVLLGFFFLGYISYKLFQETYKQNQINQEIVSLQQEIDKLNQDNSNLNELISYLQTNEFKEKEAKDKLNLIKEGEQLVLIKETEAPKESQNKESKKEAQVIVDHSNYYWWWHYYFSL